MATTDTNVSNLVINYLTETQYNQAQNSGTINANELYMTSDDTGDSNTNYIAGQGVVPMEVVISSVKPTAVSGKILIWIDTSS